MTVDESINSALQRLRRLPRATAECPTHGRFEYLIVTGAACPRCAEEAASEAKALKQRREAEERRERALDAARLVGRFRDATFATFQAQTPAQRTVLATCRDFAAELTPGQGAGLWLLGPSGIGKTHLGAAIAHALLFERCLAVKVATARDVILALRATWRPQAADTEGDVIDRIAALDLLVLDEVGAGFGTDAELSQLLSVVDARYQLRRPTVVISNLNEPQIKATLGDRLFERLREGATVLACGWPSHRKKGPFVACTDQARDGDRTE